MLQIISNLTFDLERLHWRLHQGFKLRRISILSDYNNIHNISNSNCEIIMRPLDGYRNGTNKYFDGLRIIVVNIG